MAEWGTASTGMTSASSSVENTLISRLKRIEHNTSGYFAIQIHLSHLRKGNRQAHFIQIATRTFDNLVEGNDASLFTMTNQDLVLVCRNVDVDVVDTVIDKVRGLFSEDPLTEVDESGFEDNFSTWYDLSNSEDFASFFSVIADLSLEAERLQAEKISQRDKDKAAGEPLEAANLSEINMKLMRSRIADLLQHQTCLLVRSGGAGEVVFREHFVSMAQVRERIAPDKNLFASPWLFQYLTETLDRRILSVLAEWDFSEIEDPISINLNVSTILSRDFQAFHKAVGDHTHKVVIEMHIIDVFADTKNFGYARDSLQDRGYRVLVDGLDPMSLQFFEVSKFAADFIKIGWNQSLQEEDGKSRLEEMRKIILSAGRESVILGRVDTEKAVKWGLGIGVSRFQGFFIDRLAEVAGSGKKTL
ncbi:MAG: EAL domain-containing protein [Rhodospirillales bacterium]|nr:EAL domain-containing protein [Rhodospirillales bacterium]